MYSDVVVSNPSKFLYESISLLPHAYTSWFLHIATQLSDPPVNGIVVAWDIVARLIEPTKNKFFNFMIFLCFVYLKFLSLYPRCSLTNC